VPSVSEGKVNGVHSVFYDLLRFEGGEVAEHWDVVQPIPTENLANDNGMFGFEQDVTWPESRSRDTPREPSPLPRPPRRRPLLSVAARSLLPIFARPLARMLGRLRRLP
jgi:hypothetical protein